MEKTLVHIGIGSLTMAVDCHDLEILDSVKKSYASCIGNQEAGYVIRINTEKKFDAAQYLDQVNVSCENNIYSIRSADFEGFLDINSKRGEITIHSSWPQQAAVKALENMCVFLTVSKGGIVLHAAGIVKDNKAYIFFGPSGSGKSTVARLSSRYQVLGDELIGLECNGNDFRAFSLANGAEFGLQGSFEIAAMFKLIKDKGNDVKIMPRAKAIAECFIVPQYLDSLMPPLSFIGRFTQLARTVKCYELHFLPDDSFWKCIEEHESARIDTNASACADLHE